MNKKMTKRLLTIIISIGVLVMGIIYFSFSGHPSANTVLVSQGDVVSGVSLSGVVKAQKQAHLGFGSASPATITKLFLQRQGTM